MQLKIIFICNRERLKMTGLKTGAAPALSLALFVVMLAQGASAQEAAQDEPTPAAGDASAEGPQIRATASG
jgi:hypothetical protein